MIPLRSKTLPLNKPRTVLLLIAILFIAAPWAGAQSDQGLPPTDPLYKTISALDTALFDAYNSCDLEKFGSMIADDIEFYHDQTGLSIGKQNLVDGVKNNICGKVHRELVPGTLEVYPIKGYGAVEIGVHRFTHPGDPTNIGEAKFVTLWQLKDGSWKISRAFSFDHHPVSR
jgi:ketosteroid isomerase-like protein